MVRGGGLRRAEDRRSRSGRPTTDAPRPRAGPGGPGAAGGAGGFRSGTAPGPGDGPRPGAVRTVRDGDARRVVAATPEAGPEGADPPEHPHAGPACGPERGRGAPRPAGVRARAPPSGNLPARRGPAGRPSGRSAGVVGPCTGPPEDAVVFGVGGKSRRRRCPAGPGGARATASATASPARPPRRRRPVRHGVAGWCRRRHRAEEFPAFPRPTGKAAGVPRAPGSARSRTTTRRTPAAGRRPQDALWPAGRTGTRIPRRPAPAGSIRPGASSPGSPTGASAAAPSRTRRSRSARAAASRPATTPTPSSAASPDHANGSTGQALAGC